MPRYNLRNLGNHEGPFPSMLLPWPGWTRTAVYVYDTSNSPICHFGLACLIIYPHFKTPNSKMLKKPKSWITKFIQIPHYKTHVPSQKKSNPKSKGNTQTTITSKLCKPQNSKSKIHQPDIGKILKVFWTLKLHIIASYCPIPSKGHVPVDMMMRRTIVLPFHRASCNSACTCVAQSMGEGNQLKSKSIQKPC